MKAYSGIGSRTTPPDVLSLFEAAALHLAYRGWTLRSGCAPGADSAFEQGAWSARDARHDVPRPELYLPWPGFEHRRRTLVARERPQREAYNIAAQFHPAWERLSSGVRALHTRNVHQVLGPDVTSPLLSRFVLCWTPGGSGSGGTGQAIRIARAYDVPVIDVGASDGRRRLEEFLSTA